MIYCFSGCIEQISEICICLTTYNENVRVCL